MCSNIKVDFCHVKIKANTFKIQANTIRHADTKMQARNIVVFVLVVFT